MPVRRDRRGYDPPSDDMYRLESRLLERRQPRHCLPCLQGLQGLQRARRAVAIQPQCARSWPGRRRRRQRSWFRQGFASRRPQSRSGNRLTARPTGRHFRTVCGRLWTTPKMRNPAAATSRRRHAGATATAAVMLQIAPRTAHTAKRDTVAAFQHLPADAGVVDARAVRRADVNQTPFAARIKQRFRMAAAGRGIVAFGEDEVVVAAAPDADARPGEHELLTAPAPANRPQPKNRH